jgi:hypothetical protein
MEVSDRQEVGFSFGEPGSSRSALAPGAVSVAAAVVGDAPVPAVLTGFDVTAQCGGAAGLDR